MAVAADLHRDFLIIEREVAPDSEKSFAFFGELRLFFCLFNYITFLKFFKWVIKKNRAANAARSAFLDLILCDTIDGSPPGSPVPGILKARTLEWVAISFSNA